MEQFENMLISGKIGMVMKQKYLVKTSTCERVKYSATVSRETIV